MPYPTSPVHWLERAFLAGRTEREPSMTSQTIETPSRAGSRDQARALLEALPQDLSASEVLVDGSSVLASAPSFVDELVKIILVQRKAACLVLSQAPERTREYAERSAKNRGVASRLVTAS